MTTMCKGIINGNVIKLEARLPYPAGTEVTVQVEAAVRELLPPSEEAWSKFETLIGIGHSGLADVSRNKHGYLAGAYDEGKQEKPPAGE